MRNTVFMLIFLMAFVTGNVMAVLEDDLLPRPRVVEPRYGNFALDSEQMNVLLIGQSKATDRLSSRLDESFTRAGLKVASDSIDTKRDRQGLYKR